MEREKLELLYDKFLQIGKITTDTRTCQPGSIFIALKGENFDGNEFVEQAIQAGCQLVVTHDRKWEGKTNVLVVNDTLLALQSLARFHRRQLNIPIIGITGSNGKTTTKELIVSVLKQKYRVCATQGNLNNHIGVPLTLLSMDNSTEIGVVEMGANHIGEIALLSSICLPNYGIITNIGNAHLEGFGSYQGVITAKSELYKHINEHAGLLFVNANDELLMNQSSGIKRVLYGAAQSSIVECINLTVNPFLSFQWKSAEANDIESVATNLIGKYNIDNLLAAICIASYFDIEAELINKALSEYEPKNNRSQLIETASNKILLDAYNANPTSMNAAIENFADIEAPNKVIILGGMKELGDVSIQEHINLVKKLKEKEFDAVFLIGDEFKTIERPIEFKWFENTNYMIDWLKTEPINNSFILIKGSRSNKLEVLTPYF